MKPVNDFLGENENNQPDLADYQPDLEKAAYLQQILINACTNDGPADDEHYVALRKYFLSKEGMKDKIPSWIRTNRNLAQFWQFIKFKIGTYAERRKFIWDEFSLLLDYIEIGDSIPHAAAIDEKLKILNSGYIQSTWTRALERKNDDPEGAITLSRTLLESVLKHIADELKLEYSKGIDLHDLYKNVAEKLNLSPNQHCEKIFKQILGGCSGIISGLGCLRNDLGNAHGHGKVQYRPSSRHAELAINLSGSMCSFLLETYEWNKIFGKL